MGRGSLAVDYRPPRPLETKHLPLSVRRLLEAHDIDSLQSTKQVPTKPHNHRDLQTPGLHLLPLNQLRLPQAHLTVQQIKPGHLHTPEKFKNTFEINETFLDPPRVPKTAPSKFRKVPKVLYFPVLRAIETDRGGEFRHNRGEVERDPFLKTVLPGEVGFIRGQMKMIRDLVSVERGGELRDLYEERFRIEKATRHDIQVQVDELFAQTREFMETNCLDKETGRLSEMWTGNRAVDRLDTVEDKMDYLHAVFMWMVQGCYERRVWDGKKEDVEPGIKKQKPKPVNAADEELHHSISTLFGASKFKSEKNKLIESLRPPKPIPPQDIRSIGWKIRRQEAASLHNVPPETPASVKKILKNERHLEGATLEEIKRVRKILSHYHNEARIGKDQLDFRENFVTPDSKSFIDWVREKEQCLFETTSDENSSVFSVREFVANFLKLQKTNAQLNGTAETMSAPSTPHKVEIPSIIRQSTTGRESVLGHRKSKAGGRRVSILNEAEIMTSNPILFARRKSGSQFRDNTTNKPLTFIGAANGIQNHLSSRKVEQSAVLKFSNAVKRRASSFGIQRRNSAKPLKTPAEIISYKVPSSALWNIFHDEIVVILKKSAWERTSEEIQILFSVLRCQPAFSKLSDFVVKEVCYSSLNYREYPRNCPVFRQNDVAQAWHILLTGRVNVMKSYTGNLEDEVKLRSLNQGQGFGDIGLMNDTIRSASIVTAERCEIIEVEK
ncbi:hypothetical protein BDR26DRAFT_849357, partial [Obelidium mucronatum]